MPFPSLNLEQIQEAEQLSQSDTEIKRDKSYLEQLEEMAKKSKTASSLQSPSLDEHNGEPILDS